MKQRPVRLQIESLYIDHAAVARFHDYGDSPLASGFAQSDLHHQIVALFDEQVDGRIEHTRQRLLGDSFGKDFDLQVGVELEEMAGGEYRLVHAKISHRRMEPVQVRQAQRIEIGKSETSANALQHHGRDD